MMCQRRLRSRMESLEYRSQKWDIVLPEVRRHFEGFQVLAKAWYFIKPSFGVCTYDDLLRGFASNAQAKPTLSEVVNWFIVLEIHNTSLPLKSAEGRFRCFSLVQFSRVQTRSLLFFLFHFTQEHRRWFLPENASCLMCSHNKLVLTSLHVALSWAA